MQVKDVAASVVLGLLFVSLLAIYLVTDQNPLVTGLSIIIIAICLIIVRVGDWREIGIIASIAAIVSLVAAHLVGQERFGNLGGVLLPTAWGLVLVGIFSWISANIQRVPGDRAILSVRTYTGEVVNQPAPLATPMLPFLERPLATIPLYTLSADEPVKDINTKGRYNVGEIMVHVEYRIADRESAPRALAAVPNRGQVFERIAKELNKNVDEARTNVLFWEKLLDFQMRAEVDDVARLIIRQEVSRPSELITNLAGLAIEQKIQDALNERVNRWGVVASHLAIDKVLLPPEAWRDPQKEAEAELKRQETDYMRVRNLHTAQLDAEAERIRQLIAAVREAGIDPIPPELMEDIIVSATTDPSDRVLDLEVSRWFKDNFNQSSDKKK